MSTLFETIQMRRDTYATWIADNPVLNQGEMGYEYDTYRIKIGNGISDWLTLPYLGNVYSNSSTVTTIGTGSKTLLCDVGLAFAPNMVVTISYASDPTKYMIGIVTSYNAITGYIIINVTSVNGSGSNLTPWVIWASSGAQGPQGIQGIQGAQGTAGATGAGLIIGGLPGQTLVKNSITDYDLVWAYQSNNVNQTVIKAAVDAYGNANFISIGTGLSVNIAATAINVLINFAAGYGSGGGISYAGAIVSNTSITSLANNTTNYLYAERNISTGVITLSAVIVPPARSYVAPSHAANQYWYSSAEDIMYLSNGTNTWNAKQVVFLGEAVTSGGAVTSVINYALRGQYDSGLFGDTTGSATTSKNHNLGCIPNIVNIRLVCIDTEGGYAIGDEISPQSPAPFTNIAWNYGCTLSVTKNTLTVANAANGQYATPKTGGTVFSLTAAKWNYRVIVKRD